MKFFLPIIFLLGISGNVRGKGIRRERSNNEYELSYQELINMNVSCYPSDSCKEFRTDDPPVPTFGDKCSCHSQCWEYGTCCIDSQYIDKTPIQKCVHTGLKTYYMVHRCPDNTHPDSIWRNHCEREWTDDIFSITPVTSLDSSRTYKNYYCFRCHETTDKYVSWNLAVSSFYSAPTEAYISSLTYNQTEKSWLAILDGNPVPINVLLEFSFPHNVQAQLMECYTFRMFDVCPELADKRVNAKCLAYSAVVYDKYSTYKNVHCALCNNVSLEELTCNLTSSSGAGGAGGAGGWGGSADPFRCMYDYTDEENGRKCDQKDRPNNSKSCNGEYKVWDKYAKICRELGCAGTGYVLKNKICVKV